MARIEVVHITITPNLTDTRFYLSSFLPFQKLIKELPSLVPADDKDKKMLRFVPSSASNPQQDSPEAPPVKSQDMSKFGLIDEPADVKTETAANNSCAKNEPKATRKKTMGKSPGEIAFFKLLHSELKKAAKFFDCTKQEFLLREERVREGMEIIRRPNSIMVPDKWSTMAKGIYRLYKDLLLLELYAIMTYCSFSKILKKHDKVTGYQTRIAFMANVVNKASFTRYPEVLVMIQRSEKLFAEVSQKLLIEGTSALCEDERLFISMIHRFYGQIMDKAAEEGKPDAGPGIIRRGDGLSGTGSVANSLSDVRQKLTPTLKDATSLKTLVEENDARDKDGSTCLSDDPEEASKSIGGSEFSEKRPLEKLVVSSEAMPNEKQGDAKRTKT
jgi:hypothetical protein